ncbi:MAG: hypothetical protein ABSH08_05345 [Tepidisphaeraceae bacterium]|jgi:hypothetical protein
MRNAKRGTAVGKLARKRIGLAVTTAVLGLGGLTQRSALAVAWNGTDPSFSATSSGGLTDNYGQFTNESVIYPHSVLAIQVTFVNCAVAGVRTNEQQQQKCTSTPRTLRKAGFRHGSGSTS